MDHLTANLLDLLHQLEGRNIPVMIGGVDSERNMLSLGDGLDKATKSAGCLVYCVKFQ